jgi:hypothetical protein
LSVSLGSAATTDEDRPFVMSSAVAWPSEALDHGTWL